MGVPHNLAKENLCVHRLINSNLSALAGTSHKQALVSQ